MPGGLSMQMDLLFNLQAEDTAQTAFSDLLDTVTKLQTVMDDLGATDIANLLGQVQDLAVAFQDAADNAQKVQDAVNSAMGNATDATDAAMSSVDELKTSLTEVADTTLSTVSDHMASFMDATSAAEEQVVALRDDLTTVAEINMTSAADAVNTVTDALTAANAQAADLKANLAGTGAGAGGTSGSSGGKSIFAGLGSGLFSTAMYSLMGYMGLQAMSSSANLFATMQSFMADNPGMTPTDAERAMAMLGSQGITGQSATGLMSALGGKTLQDLFTLNGMLSPQGLQLQSLGYNRSMVTASPWENLQTIGTLYRQLSAKGLGMDAMNLLSLTGTSSLQNLFTNWTAMQQGTSNMNMNMTPQQVAQQAATGQTFALDLQKLAFAFSQLTVDLVPLIQPLVQGFTDMMNVFTGKMSLSAAIKDLDNSLTLMQKAILGFVAGLVGIKIINLFRGMFSAVATMEVTAGVVNVIGAGGGGVPGGSPGGVPGDTTVPGETPGTGVGSYLGWAALAAAGLGAMYLAVRELSTHSQTTAHDMQKLNSTVGETGLQVAKMQSPMVGIDELFGIAALEKFPALRNALNAVIQTVDAVVKGIGSAFSTAASLAKAWGTDFVAAIHSGLTGVIGTISQWGSQLMSTFSSVLGPILSLLGIHTSGGGSPGGGGGTTTTQTTQQTIAQLNTQIAGLSTQFESYQKAHPGSNMNNNAQLAQYHSEANALRAQITSLQAGMLHGAPGSSAGSSSGSVGQWVSQALSQFGAGISSEWGNIMTSLAMRESGGNPNAVNPQGVQYYANNPNSIEHAMGLMQMMPSTFGAYGSGSILNPVNNISAAMQYILSRYQSPANFMAKTGFGTPSYHGYAYGGTISEPIMGMGLASGMGYMFGENGPEHFSPAGGGGASATGAINLTVNINAGATSNPQQLARMVSQEIMMQLKTRMNADLSF